MATVSKNTLKQLFNDPNYAWELLQWEIAIEMDTALSGQAIAKLLQLYMKGVQKMNSVMDIRQSYFKNKVTSLMTKNTVVKTLSKPPMSKKQKPLQISANVQAKKQIKVIEKKDIKESTEVKVPKISQPQQKINTFALQQKKKQIEMRLAYEAQQSTRQNLNKLINLHQKKQEIFQHKIKGIINNHQQRLKQRINRRKLKTATYRSRPQETNDTSSKQMDFQISQQKKEIEEHFLQNKGRSLLKLQIKRFKSVQHRISHELSLDQSPKRVRKSTFDNTDKSAQSVLQALKMISEQRALNAKQ